MLLTPLSCLGYDCTTCNSPSWSKFMASRLSRILTIVPPMLSDHAVNSACWSTPLSTANRLKQPNLRTTYSTRASQHEIAILFPNHKKCEIVDALLCCLKLNTCFMVTFHQPWSECASTHAQCYQRRHQSITTREERDQSMKCRSSFLRYLV